MPNSSSVAPDPRVEAKPTEAQSYLDERLGWSSIRAVAEKKTVPLHRHTLWYYMGGLSLFFFGVQVLTGILLMVYYQPGEAAYESVRLITYDIEFGWLIRSAHSWSANLMVGMVFLHLFSVFFMKAYRKPREFTWWSGLVLLVFVLAFGFSGYLLPMDQLAFFATKVGLGFADLLPVVGPWMADLIRGGPEIGPHTVQRFFALHVAVLPILFVGFLGLHLFLVQRHGNALPPSEEKKPAKDRKSMRFFPTFFLKDLAMWLVGLNILGVLVALSPWQLGPPADPLAPAPAGIEPEWYFMGQFQVLKVLGAVAPGVLGEWIGIGAFLIGGALFATVPLWDKKDSPPARQRLATWFGALALAGLIIFTVWGYAGH